MAQLTEEHTKQVRERVDRASADYLLGRRLWSAAHHMSIFFSIAASAAAAVTLQWQGANDVVVQKNVASALAGASALLISINTAAGFARKWQANRNSSVRIIQLQNELLTRTVTTEDVNLLNQIAGDHNKAILGG